MSKRRRQRERVKKSPDKSSASVPVDPEEAGGTPSELPADHTPAAPAESIETQIQIAHSVSVSGPLPHPEFFQAYERTLPGAADRILTMAEKQQEHRHSQQSVRLNLDGTLERRGQWMGFLVAVSGIIGGVTLIMLDKPVEGFVTLVGALGSIVGLFAWSRRRRSSTSPPDSPQAPSQEARLPAPPG